MKSARIQDQQYIESVAAQIWTETGGGIETSIWTVDEAIAGQCKRETTAVTYDEAADEEDWPQTGHHEHHHQTKSQFEAGFTGYLNP